MSRPVEVFKKTVGGGLAEEHQQRRETRRTTSLKYATEAEVVDSLSEINKQLYATLDIPAEHPNNGDYN